LNLISEVQQHQSELDGIEVKSSNKDTPQRLYDPISAFKDSTSGGVILFGLDEEGNYEIVGVGDSQRLQEEVSQLAIRSFDFFALNYDKYSELLFEKSALCNIPEFNKKSGTDHRAFQFMEGMI
jgi:predicted HTH transcriptional regulator